MKNINLNKPHYPSTYRSETLFIVVQTTNENDLAILDYSLHSINALKRFKMTLLDFDVNIPNIGD